MHLCQDLNWNMPDDLWQMWLTRGLKFSLQDVVILSSKGVLLSDIEESLKEKEALQAMAQKVQPKLTMESLVKAWPPLKASSTNGGASSQLVERRVNPL